MGESDTGMDRRVETRTIVPSSSIRIKNRVLSRFVWLGFGSVVAAGGVCAVGFDVAFGAAGVEAGGVFVEVGVGATVGVGVAGALVEVGAGAGAVVGGSVGAFCAAGLAVPSPGDAAGAVVGAAGVAVPGAGWGAAGFSDGLDGPPGPVGPLNTRSRNWVS
jgi:hypothetical protein